MHKVDDTLSLCRCRKPVVCDSEVLPSSLREASELYWVDLRELIGLEVNKTGVGPEPLNSFPSCLFHILNS